METLKLSGNMVEISTKRDALNPTKDELASWIGTAVVCCDMSGVIANRIIRALSTDDIGYIHDELIGLIDDTHKAHIVADEEFKRG